MENLLENSIIDPNVIDSTEMLIYDSFYRKNILRRIGDMGRLWDKSALNEYPLGCVIHMIDDNFLMNKPIVFVPDVNGWTLSVKPEIKYMMHITEPVEGKIPFAEKFFLPMQGINATLVNFRRKYQRWIKRIEAVKDLPNRTDVQSLISYNSLYRARIYGILRNYRRFNYVFTSVLNTVMQMPDRKHFIPIPITRNQFDRNMFLRTFKAFTKATIKYPDDMHYVFLMHFLSFIHSEKSESIFEHIPKSMWSNINLVLNAGNYVLNYNLAHLKEWNGEKDTLMIRLINQINKLAEYGNPPPTTDYQDAAAVYDTEIDESLPPEEDEVVAPTTVAPTVKQPEPKPSEKKQEVPVVKTEVSPKEESKTEPVKKEEPKKPEVEPKQVAKSSGLFGSTIKPLISNALTEKKLKESSDVMIEFMDFEPYLVTIDPKWLEVEKKEDRLNAPSFKEAPTKKEQESYNSKEVVELDKAAKVAIEEAKGLTQAQIERCKKLAVRYKEIELDGQKLDKLIASTPDDTVSTNSLDFLKDRVIDQSMLKSSVATFEHEYMQKMFKKDLAAGLTSFNAHGMFLTDIKTEDISDALNNMEKYVVKYEDTSHKEHTIRFTLPKIDERGFCYVNGTYKVFKKQRIANPICKTSPTRVALNSDSNKYLVERNGAVAHSFNNYLESMFKKATPEQNLQFAFANISYQKQTLPYEYTSIAAKYSQITFGRVGLTLTFDYENRADNPTANVTMKDIESFENDLKAVFIGGRLDRENDTNYCCFLDLKGTVTVIDLISGVKIQTTTMIDLISDLVQQEPNHLSEWVDFKILNKSMPVIFALCYKYGLTEMLKYTKAQYKIYEKNERYRKNVSDVVIKFADKKLVMPRSPLVHSLLFAGLNYYDLSKINIEEMDSKDIYFDLIQSRRLSVHNLKGIDTYFDMFMDPITKDVLNRMNEPTNTRDLLIRATQLLTTEDHPDPSSSENFRFRSYERMNAAVYKTLTRAYSTYKNKSIGASNKFSITEFEIRQMITDDQLMENVDMINPINDIKYQCEFSHTGFGGRTADTFMINDRQFPEDGVGIISEATIDSSKVALTASTSMDPTIVNLRGMTQSKKAEELEPSQILSVSSLLMPGVINDDGKRKMKVCAPSFRNECRIMGLIAGTS